MLRLTVREERLFQLQWATEKIQKIENTLNFSAFAWHGDCCEPNLNVTVTSRAPMCNAIVHTSPEMTHSICALTWLAINLIGPLAPVMLLGVEITMSNGLVFL